MWNKSVVTPNIEWCVILCNYYGDTESMEPNNNCLEDKNNSNEIILIGLFLKLKGDFPFLDI